MKRWIALLTALILFVVPFFASGEEGSLRHEVHGDVSQLVVDEESGLSHGEGSDGASVGTDVYLWVDPDAASYVTFYVIDDRGNVVPNAQIYLTYNGVTELCGISDENGLCSMYLFRNVKYDYRVTRDGYRAGTGSFTATNETRLITVVLQKYYKLTVYVKDGDNMLSGITVYVDDTKYTTNQDGWARALRVRGQYYVTVVTPDGRQIKVIAVVEGDTDIVIDISQNDGVAAGGFLVYNKYYQPEDYVLTELYHAAEDLHQQEDETDDAFQQRIERYLAENPATVLIAAQPEREQMQDGSDVDRTNEDGTPLYAQRSLMPSGALLRTWEDKFTQLVFTNEEVGISVALEELHSPSMTKLFALVDGLIALDVEQGVTQETLLADQGLRDAGLSGLQKNDIDITQIDLNAIRTFEFAFDHAAESADLPGRSNHELLSGSLYDRAVFEFRITPIVPEKLTETICEELSSEKTNADEIWLVDGDNYNTRMTMRQANGLLDESESAELCRYLTDGKLTAEELAALRETVSSGRITDEEIAELIEAGVSGKMYRLSCWVHAEDLGVNVTPLLESMQVLWTADEAYAETYEEHLRLLKDSLPDTAEREIREMYAVQLDQSVREELESKTLLMAWDYLLKEKTASHPVNVLRGVPLKDHEFYQPVSEKLYDRLTVDVRSETITVNGDSVGAYRPYVAYSTTLREEAYAFASDLTVTGLVWLNSVE